MTLITIWICAVILFLALLLSLAFQPKLLTRITGLLLLFVGLSGILLYGYGYSVLCENIPQAVARTLFSVFCMFLGRNEISAVSSVPLLKTPAMQVYLYVTHLLALYCTASAVVASVGTRLLRTLRLMLARRGDLHLIYGDGENAVAFGEKLLQQKKGFVVFVDTGSAAAADSKILRMGSLLLTDAKAKKPDAAFLKKLGLRQGSRRLTLYCLDEDAAGNLRYAQCMQDALGQAEIRPEQTRLVILLEEEALGASLQAAAGAERGGYGSVLAMEPAELAARLLIKTCPPWETLSFDEKGRAREDFEALIVGFGKTGQAVLRSLVMNGQFAGSRFHATVLARDFSLRSGSFFTRYPGLREAYPIDFIEEDARSIAVYERLSAGPRHWNYVVVCTGDRKENAEIAEELTRFLTDRGLRAPVLQCSTQGVLRCGDRDAVSLYTPELLCGGELDAMAAVINHRYHAAEGRPVSADWAACDYFSRMSCRASADYLDAFLAAAGTDRQAVLQGAWPPEAERLETLSQTEHLRWCAFHYAMGWQSMPASVFDMRAEQFRREAEQTGAGSVRISKAPEQRFHACLIPWEELDELAEREYAVTGKRPDYKQMDRDNVCAIPAMLRAAEAEGGGQL